MPLSFGWDLAGYGSSGGAICCAERKDNIVTATLLRAPFICCPGCKIKSDITTTVEIEVELLRRFAKTGTTFLDVPIDLQSLRRIVDRNENESVRYYWQLVKRPVDHVFSALEPLASNLGFAVARTCHLLGRIAAENSGLVLGVNLFETYPAATLKLIRATQSRADELVYKGGKAEFHDGEWHAAASNKEREASRRKEKVKNSGLALLAKQLNFQAPEGFALDDDEFDAVLCAVTGCIPGFTLHQESLAKYIRDKLAAWHTADSWEDIEPPIGYAVFDRLPPGMQIELVALDFASPEELFSFVV